MSIKGAASKRFTLVYMLLKRATLPLEWAVAFLIHVFLRGVDTDDRHNGADDGDNNTYDIHDNCNPHYVPVAPFLRFIIQSPPLEMTSDNIRRKTNRLPFRQHP